VSHLKGNKNNVHDHTCHSPKELVESIDRGMFRLVKNMWAS